VTAVDQRDPPDDPVGLLRWYQEAWNDLDLERILDAYATPCFVAKGGRVLHHRDQAGKARYFGDLLAGTGARARTAGSSATSTCAAWAATAPWSPSAGPAGGPTARSSGSSPTPACWRASGDGGGSSATWSTNDVPQGPAGVISGR
jgi:hypothetical protein